MRNENNPSLRQYVCHKQVRAAKIEDIAAASNGISLIFPEDNDNGPDGVIVVSEEYIERHNPQSGGYYVLYEDGYESYSPPEPFEEGYSLVPPEAEPDAF